MPDTVNSPAPTILVVGPAVTHVGGMASVVGQMLDTDFGGRYRFQFLPITTTTRTGERLGHRIFRHVHQMRRLRTAIRETGAAIVHIHTCSGFSFFRSVVDMLIACRLGCRVILHIHGARFDEFHAMQPPYRQRLVGWSLARADRVVVLSRRWHEKLREMSPLAEFVVIENAVEVHTAVPEPRPDGVCRFVLLARMDEWKDIDDLLEACRHLERANIRVEVILAGPAGTAGDARVLDDKIRSRGLDNVVRYVGEVRDRAKSDLLAAADVYVQPSHNEGMPIALLEALAHGLPVVATRVGAVPEVVEDECQGLIVPPHRPDMLAEAMRRLAADPGRRLVMSEAARKRVAGRFGLTRFRRDLGSLYDSVMASSRTRAESPPVDHTDHDRARSAAAAPA